MTTLPDTSQSAPYQLLPPLEPEERTQLKEDIRRRGVAVPIEVDEDGNILDGHHRLMLWAELRHEGVNVPQYDQIIRRGMTEDEKKDYVLALNLKRRHLTPEQKAFLYARLRKPPFNMTLQQIADIAQVGVGTVHRHIEALPDDVKAELEQLAAVGRDGKVYPAKYLPRLLVSAEKLERDFTASNYGSAGDQSADVTAQYLVIVEVADEAHQTELLERLVGEGFDCKAVIS